MKSNLGSSLVEVLGLLITMFDAFKQITMVYLHRMLVVARELSGLPVFDSLEKCPRHVCLVISKPSRTDDIERAVRTLISAGVERVTVSHDGCLALSEESFTESVTSDMGRSKLVSNIRLNRQLEEISNPDAVLVLLLNSKWAHFSSNVVVLPKCLNASLLYYSEIIPLYSLKPSDVFLAASMFQSKSQRFGR